ncbi:MAG: sigma 54-interacting transcriptional regulator, partial [Deltaproteobacteria bacterium]|nr:sigma 54-interacting transcriptional regulator [Deltaproteobacteria bacterium]
VMGRDREAIKQLPDIQDRNSTAYWIANMVRIYQTFIAGRIKEAHAAIFHMFDQWWQTGQTFHQYPSPQLLEMIDEFDRLSLTPIPLFTIQSEMQRIMEGPNIHLKGVALRLKACRFADGFQKYNCLKESEDCLVQSGDPIEVSKTRIELARLHLARGDQAQALTYALKAHEGVSGLGERFFPDDLRHLLREDASGAAPTIAGRPSLEDVAEMIANLIPSLDVQDLMGQLLLAVSGYVRAERAGLFRFDKEGALLKSAHNLSADEVFGEVFRGSLALVFTVHQRQEPICRPVTAGDGSSRRVLCLPVEAGVLYFENSYDRQAFDFLDAGMLRSLSRILSAAVRKILEYGRLRLERERQVEPTPLGGELPAGGEFLTADARMQSILAQLDRAAASDATILITGETGVGKEILARRVHAMSLRKAMPMVTVDLTSIPETLVESELFGHEKGAFTGADSQRRGRIELADKGTLFIDELGEVPAAVQVKLLRTLQEKTCMRLGGGRLIATDFRLVAATNRNLGEEVKAGRFRRDLYYRVNVMEIHVPPLRERPEDIRLLARHFLERYAAKYQNTAAALTPEDEARLLSYAWPGNVRELQNVIERSVLLAHDDRINLSLPLASQPSAAHPFTDFPTMEELQRRYITWVLERTGGRIGGGQGAAEILGMKRTSLNARLKKLGLRRAGK